MAIDDSTLVIGLSSRITRERFTQILSDRGSPAATEAGAGWDIVKQDRVDPLFALAIFHQESQFATDPSSVTVQFNTRNPGNARSSRIGDRPIVNTPFGPFVKHPSWPDGWRNLSFRLVDPTFVYHLEGRRTIRTIIERFAPPPENNTENYIARVVTFMNEFATDEATTPDTIGETTMELDFGKVPHPVFVDRLIPDSQNSAFDNLGQRRPIGTCVHRMDGTLVGTDGFFRSGAAALTDYGIGGSRDTAVQFDGAVQNLDGVIFRWNDPTGAPHAGVSANRAPHANGPANDLEGDGPAYVNTLGINAVNRDLASIELSGFMDEEITDKQFESLCQLVAFWHDQARVPWDQFPQNPNVGVVTQMQHFEFGPKSCPGPVVHGRTNEYQERVRQIMRQHQLGD